MCPYPNNSLLWSTHPRLTQKIYSKPHIVLGQAHTQMQPSGTFLTATQQLQYLGGLLLLTGPQPSPNEPMYDRDLLKSSKAHRRPAELD